MTISFVAAGAASSGLSTITPGLPSGFAAGDLHLLIVQSSNQAVTAPTGFTQIGSLVGTGTAAAAGAVGLAVFYRVAVGGDTAPTVADSGDHTLGYILGFRGVDQTNPINVSTSNTATSSTSVVVPAVTTLNSQCCVVGINANSVDSNTVQVTSFAAASLTGVVTTTTTSTNTTSGTGGGAQSAYGFKATAGSTGTFTATQGTASTQAHFTVALKPAIAVAKALAVTGAEALAVAPVKRSITQVDLTSDSNLGLTSNIAKKLVTSLANSAAALTTKMGPAIPKVLSLIQSQASALGKGLVKAKISALSQGVVISATLSKILNAPLASLSQALSQTDLESISKRLAVPALINFFTRTDAWAGTPFNLATFTTGQPDVWGGNTAALLVPNTTGGTTHGTALPAVGLPTGVNPPYSCRSVFAKAAGYDQLVIIGNFLMATFDLTNVTATPNAAINPLAECGIEVWPNGWYRCWTARAETFVSSGQINVAVGGTNFFAGNGTSGILVCSPQLEVETRVASPFIPNTSTSASSPWLGMGNAVAITKGGRPKRLAVFQLQTLRFVKALTSQASLVTAQAIALVLPGGGATFSSVLAITQSQLASVARSFGKLVSSAQSFVLTKLIVEGKSLATSQSQSVSVASQQSYLRALTVLVSQTFNVVRSSNKRLSFAGSQLVSVLGKRAYLKIVAVLANQTFSLTRSIGKNLTSTLLGVTALLGQRAYLRQLTVLTSQTFNAVHSFGKSLTSTLLGVTALLGQRAYLRTLPVLTGQTFNVTRSAGKSLATTLLQVTSALGQRAYLRQLAVLTSQTFNVARSLGKRLSLAWSQVVAATALKLLNLRAALLSASSVNLGALRSLLRTLPVLQGQVIGRGTSVGKGLAITLPYAVASLRALARPLRVVQPQLASASSGLKKMISVVSASSLSLVQLRSFFRQFALTAGSSVALARQTGKILALSVGEVIAERGQRAFLLSAAVVQGSNVAVLRVLRHLSSITLSPTLSLVRSIKHQVSIAWPQLIDSTALVAKQLTISWSQLVASIERKAHLRALSLAHSLGLSITRQLGVALALLTTNLATLARSVGSRSSVRLNSTLNRMSSVGKSLKLAQGALVKTVRSLTLPFALLTNQILGLTRSLGTSFELTWDSVVALQVRVSKKLSTELGTLVQSVGLRTYERVAQFTQSQALRVDRSFSLIRAITASYEMSLRRLVGRRLNAITLDQGVALARAQQARFALAVSQAVSSFKSVGLTLAAALTLSGALSVGVVKLIGVTTALTVTNSHRYDRIKSLSIAQGQQLNALQRVIRFLLRRRRLALFSRIRSQRV